MTTALSALEPVRPRLGRVNWIGLQTLYVKEVMRFFKVLPQTVFAPMVTTLLFLIVFKVAVSAGRAPPPGGVSFEHFLAPGLIMMAITQNAFMNTSSSLLVSKVQGNVVDILMPPLSAAELTLAFVLGGITRGLVVALSIAVAMLAMPFPTLMVTHFWAILYFALAGAMLLSGCGVLAGIWAEKFDHVAVVTNFVVTPLSFLSGTFYSVERLGHFWAGVSRCNPFFFLIDGFRYGFTGHAASEIGTGALVLLVLNIVVLILCHRIFKSGYRLKS
jgi:ABC-2 type transport system permease protein